MSARDALERRWLHLTRVALPAVADARGWPVRADHCFMRVLLDQAFGARWSDHVAGRPAYRRIDDARLAKAIALGEALLAGEADAVALDAASIAWRGKPPKLSRRR